MEQKSRQSRKNDFLKMRQALAREWCELSERRPSQTRSERPRPAMARQGRRFRPYRRFSGTGLGGLGVSARLLRMGLPGKPILALRWIRAGLGSTGPRRPGQEAKKSKFSESKSTKLHQESAKGDAKSTKLPVPPYGRERKHAERRLEAPKKHPRDAKGRQRGAKGWPRGRQGRPKGGQGEAKGRQKAAKERPGEAKGGQARPEAKKAQKDP